MTSDAGSSGVARDLADLRRGAVVNALGYAIKLAQPVLLVIVVRLYGAAAFGVFTAASAVLMLAGRVGILGLDKAVLWWVPQQDAGQERRGILGALLLATACNAALAVALVVAADALLGWWIDSSGVLSAIAVMAPAIVPMAAMEVLVHASLGKRRMGAQVIVREGIVPIALVVTAIAAWALDAGDVGLPIAFVVSYAAGFVGAAVVFRSNFADSTWPQRRRVELPARMVRFGLPMWLSELLNSALQRLDVYALAAVADDATIGVYGAVVQIANVIRMVRRSFDPIVVAIVAGVRKGGHDAMDRLAAGFSHATVLVVATQLPIFAFLVVFAPWLLDLFGDGFSAGADAVVILCAFWAVNGALGLCGLVVSGSGHSGHTLINVIVATISLSGLLAVLVGPGGLEGAAWAVGLGYTIQNVMQLVQMRVLTGGWHYQREVAWAIAAGVLAGAATLAAWLVWPGDSSSGRVVAFAVFAIVYGLAVLRLRTAGMLSSGARR